MALIDRFKDINIDKAKSIGLVNFEGNEDQAGFSFPVYLMDELSKKDKIDIINMLDFEVIKTDKGYRLKDLQGANLANIELETFKNLSDALQRLNVYMFDYLIAVVTREEYNYLIS